MMRCSHCQVEGEKFNEAPTALRSFLDKRYEVRQTQNSALIFEIRHLIVNFFFGFGPRNVPIHPKQTP